VALLAGARYGVCRQLQFTNQLPEFLLDVSEFAALARIDHRAGCRHARDDQSARDSASSNRQQPVHGWEARADDFVRRGRTVFPQPAGVPAWSNSFHRRFLEVSAAARLRIYRIRDGHDSGR
jgi:hypothetical protein